MSLVDFGKRLLECAKQGETEEVRLLMTNGAPFTTDWLGTSPLHMAAEYGHVTTAEVLLRAGISRDARTKVDRTPLHVAAQEGHTAVVELLIKHGAEVNAQDMLQMTPLHWAVERDHIPVIKCLLEHDADLSIRSKFNKTPMDIAVDNGTYEVFQILREDYARTKPGKNKEKKTPPSPPVLSMNKTPLPKSIPIPFKVVKTDGVASTCVKEISIKSAVQTLNSVTTSNSFGGSAEDSLLPHPILLKTNLSNANKDTKSSSFSDSDEGEPSEQSCTNVLAAFAALAEATAPNATTSMQEALQWLERHGITMLSSDNTTTVASALEGGQTVSLTEAGKLALTWVKEQKQFTGDNSKDLSNKKEKQVFCTLQSKNVSPSQLIKVVSEKSQVPSVITQPQPIFIVSNQNSNSAGNRKEQPSPKKMKIDEIKLDIGSFLGKPNITTVSSVKSAYEDEKSLLQKELEKIRKQAEEYKAQLIVKEHEAEEYRKQLEELKNTSVNQ